MSHDLLEIIYIFLIISAENNLIFLWKLIYFLQDLVQKNSIYCNINVFLPFFAGIFAHLFVVRLHKQTVTFILCILSVFDCLPCCILIGQCKSHGQWMQKSGAEDCHQRWFEWSSEKEWRLSVSSSAHKSGKKRHFWVQSLFKYVSWTKYLFACLYQAARW